MRRPRYWDGVADRLSGGSCGRGAKHLRVALTKDRLMKKGQSTLLSTYFIQNVGIKIAM